MNRLPAAPTPNDDDLSAEEIRQMWRRQFWRRFLLIGLAVAAVLAIAAAAGIPLVKDWRARQFAAKADLLRAEGKVEEAYSHAASAIQIRPRMPEARRAYAAVLVAAGRPEAIAVFQGLIEDGNATPQDRLDLAEASLRFGDIALAEKEAFRLMQQGQRTSDALFVLARVRLAQQRGADAMQALQECVEAGGGAEPAILLARLRFAANTPDSAQAAVALLRPIAAQKDAAGLAALMALLGSPALRTDEAGAWIEAVRAHPLAGDEQKLAAANAQIERDPASRSDVLRRALDEYRGASPDRRLLLSRWLNQRREYAAALEIIPADEASARSDLFLVRLDALAGMGDWKSIAEMLRAASLPLQGPVALLYRGRAARELGEKESSAAFYRRAIIEAAPTPDLMWYVINYLQRVGETQVLEQELTRLTNNPAIARQAFQALVPIVQSRQDAEELYLLYDRMLKALPAERVVQNDYRYFAALTGRRADTGGARELVAAEPQMLAYRVTLAFTLLKNGQSDDALHIFDGVTLDPAQIQPYQRAVLAAVLGANGRENEARQLANSIPGDALTTKELELIAPWRTAN